MSFPINTAIPNLPNNPVNDVPLMKTNFANISGFLAVDHVAPGATNAGIHNQVHLVNESAPGLIGTGGVLYANITAGNSFPFWQNALGSFPLLSPVTASVSGSTTLPGGIILQWGTVAPTNATTVPVTFTPTFTNIFNASITRFRATASPDPGSSYEYYIDASSLTTTGFNLINRDGHTYGFYWFAIGN